jgi:hypothetical protein
MLGRFHSLSRPAISHSITEPPPGLRWATETVLPITVQLAKSYLSNTPRVMLEVPELIATREAHANGREMIGEHH